MLQGKSKNKIYVILILCVGVVTSVWLFSRNSLNVSVVAENQDSLSTDTYKNTDGNTNDSWKNLLGAIDEKNTTKAPSLTANNSEQFDETTLTAQMAKDFFSQYLLVKKGGQDLTSADAEVITQNILASPQYSKSDGPMYLWTNLHIINKKDAEAVKKYETEVNLSLKQRSSQVTINPVLILNNALLSGKSNELPKLDIVINAGKGLIKDFLVIEVPIDAVSVHLNLLNAASNVVANLESMREILNDPVRTMSGTSQYNQHMIEFQSALTAMNNYFQQKH